MKKIIFLSFLLLASCGSGGGGGSDSSGESKDLFSRWKDSDTSFYLDFTGGQFDTVQTLYVNMPTSQTWIDALNSAGRDTTGLVAGTIHLCEMDILFTGSQASGTVKTNHDDIDTPEHNACLEWDSDCSVGVCNVNGNHLYEKSGNTLVIDYFGVADGGSYGVDSLL